MEGQQLQPAVTSTATTWPDWQKQIVAILLLAFLVVLLFFMRPVIGPLVLTFAISFVLMYPIRLLQRFARLSYQLSALLVYFVFFILSLVAIGWFVGYAVSSMFATLQNAQQFIEQVFAAVDTEEGVRGALDLNFALSGLKTLSLVGTGLSLVSAPGEFVAGVVERISAFTSFVSGYGLVLVVLLFFLLEWPATLQMIGRRFPPTARREYAILFQRMFTLANRYLVGSLLIVLFYWGVTALLFFLSGVPYPIVLGLLVAIPNFIPQGGGLVSAILVFVITLVTGSTTFATNRLIFAFIQMTIFMLVSGVAYYFVDVRIYSKSVRVPVWIILISIVVFTAYMGVIGAFIAAAVVAMLGEVLEFILKKLRGEDPYPDVPEPATFLSEAERESLAVTPDPAVVEVAETN
jgi:predicted PurR-regulated permease PerM